jgi:hypothetical protein
MEAAVALSYVDKYDRHHEMGATISTTSRINLDIVRAASTKPTNRVRHT